MIHVAGQEYAQVTHSGLLLYLDVCEATHGIPRYRIYGSRHGCDMRRGFPSVAQLAGQVFCRHFGCCT